VRRRRTASSFRRRKLRAKKRTVSYFLDSGCSSHSIFKEKAGKAEKKKKRYKGPSCRKRNGDLSKIREKKKFNQWIH